MTVTYIRWADACAKEAADAPAAIPELSELAEVGFLLAEDDNSVLIGMEMDLDGTHPGRWRLNIPKVNIKERRDVLLSKAFGTSTRKRKAAIKT